MEIFVPKDIDQKFRDLGIKPITVVYEFQLKHTGILYWQIIEWFRINHGLVLDVYQEFDEDLNAYTNMWALDISKLHKYENPHIIEFTECFPDFHQAWNVLIEAALTLKRI